MTLPRAAGVSTGVYRWPAESAAEIVLEAVQDSPVELVRFVLFDQGTYDAYARARLRRGAFPDLQLAPAALFAASRPLSPFLACSDI